MGPTKGTTGKMITAFGETKNILAWVADPRCKVSQPSLSERLMKGWEPERAISEPPTKGNGREKMRVEIGAKFNRLTLVRQWMDQRDGQNSMKGEFECECGRRTEQWVTVVKQGRVQSCGCLLSEKSRERIIARSTTHGMSKHGLYSQYQAMLNRCYRPEHISYVNYGGRGITVCDEWKSDFEAFAAWAFASGWQKGLTIDRRDNDLGYSPSNCHWATHSEQQNNKRTNRRVSGFGETKTLVQWSRDIRCIVPYYVLFDRINKLQWDLERAMTQPQRVMPRDVSPCDQRYSSEI